MREVVIEASGTVVCISLVDGQVGEGVDAGHVFEDIGDGCDGGPSTIMDAPVLRVLWVLSSFGSDHLYRFNCLPALEVLGFSGNDVLSFDGLDLRVLGDTFSPLLCLLDLSRCFQAHILVRLLLIPIVESKAIEVSRDNVLIRWSGGVLLIAPGAVHLCSLIPMILVGSLLPHLQEFAVLLFEFRVVGNHIPVLHVGVEILDDRSVVVVADEEFRYQ